MRRLGSLRVDRRGTATIEFALVSLFLFATLMVALDFAVYAQQKLKLGNVVEQAAVLAFNQQVGANTAGIKSYVETYSGMTVAPTATITCNGTATCGDGKCSCIGADGSFTIVATCNTKCPSNASFSGNYLKISATAVYSSVIVPNTYLSGGNIVQSAVVRLQ